MTFQKHRAAPQNYEKEFLPSSVDLIGDIRRWNDPVSNSFPCLICFRDAFGGACFPSGTHALMYATAVYYGMPTAADAIFAAGTTAEIKNIARNFPAYDKKWNDRAEELQWEIFQWKFDHVPSFTRRLDKSEGVNFISHTYDNYWGTGHNGHGRNMHGKHPAETDGTHPEIVIVSVGINDRANTPGVTTIPNLRRMAVRAGKCFPNSVKLFG